MLKLLPSSIHDHTYILYFFAHFLDLHLTTATKSPSYRAWGAYELGMCYAHLGKTKDAFKWFALAESAARDKYDWDQFAKRKSVGFIKVPFSDIIYGSFRFHLIDSIC